MLTHAVLAEALGNEPFPWQQRLFDHLRAGRLPEALDLPTGLGKTSVMAIWLAARLAGATTLPRRLVYVVDRRAVVDQASTEAERLSGWWSQAALSEGCDEVTVSTLRGQFLDNRRWLEDPSGLALVVGTVDMIGSRMLFQGYSTSRRMRPYHAALLAHDSWIVLDESHLVPPFEHLLERICSDSTLHPEADDLLCTPQRSRLLSLSATGRQRGDPFRLDEQDLEHPIVRQRIQAPKRLTLDASTGKTPARLATLAFGLAQHCETPSRILVFANSRDAAGATAQQLRKLCKPSRRGASHPSVQLFTGARRVRERHLAAAELAQDGFLAGSDRPQEHAFLVATSAAEVGVDLDADHLVCDCVPWERMVQRLGRVNRRGGGEAEVIVLEDPTLEGPAARSLELLQTIAQAKDSKADLSPASLDAFTKADPTRIDAARSPAPLRPRLELPQLEDWAMTSLDDHSGRPDVAPWLRGWIEDLPQTRLVWRRLLPSANLGDAALGRFLEAAAPHMTELLELDSEQVAKWLLQRRAALAADLRTDVLLTDHSGQLIGRLTPDDLERSSAHRNGSKRLARQIQHRTLWLHEDWAGLSSDGLLDAKWDTIPVTLDHAGSAGDWLGDTETAIPFRIRETESPVADLDGVWQERFRVAMRTDATDEEAQSWIVIEKLPHDPGTEEARSAGRPQTLREHQDWTRAEMERLSARLEIDGPLRQALCLAARLHDEGKRAERWQRAFSASDDAVYAKTRGPVRVATLDGYRHELGSLGSVRDDSEFSSLPSLLQDLVLHIVAAHHGYARPTISGRSQDDAPPSIVQTRVEEVARRFARLQEQLGPYGLAWWETLLRAADQRASRRNDEEGQP